jgi:hypothetical protein
MTKQCTDCRMIRPSECFGQNRHSSDGLRSMCRDCLNQAKRISTFKKQERLRPPRPDISDDILRNNLHHLRSYVTNFFHGTDYSWQGPCLHIPTKTPMNFILRRIPNTALVEVRITSLGVDTLFYGINRLEEDAVEKLCAVLRDYRIEPSDMAMKMAMLYIYDKV